MNNLETAIRLHQAAQSTVTVRGIGTPADLNYRDNLADKFNQEDDCRSPERQALASQAIDEQIAESQWGQVAKLLIQKRDGLREALDPEAFFSAKEPAHLEVIGMAASALGPSIAIAVRNQRQHADALAAIKAKLPPPLPGYTRIIPTNIEMAAGQSAEREARHAIIARDGCCGGTPMPDGVCFGIGVCPRAEEAKDCKTFCERLIAWTDDLDAERIANELQDSIPPLTIGDSDE